MVPPSDNIEFFESKYFQKVTAARPELKKAILEQLRKWPLGGLEFAHGVRELKLFLVGQEYVVIFRRQGNRLRVMHLYELPQDANELEEMRASITKLFGPKAERSS